MAGMDVVSSVLIQDVSKVKLYFPDTCRASVKLNNK